MEEKIYSVAVIGGGIAGYTAALTLNSLKEDFIWLGAKYGGKLLKAERVRNFPSFTGSGAELAVLLEAQREKECFALTEVRIDGIYSAGGEFVLTAGEKIYRARAVILATGVETAGSVKNEAEFLGRGVSYCAVCDGALYKGKKIAAVLSSKEFEREAEFLAGFASEVYAFCLYPKPCFRAGNITLMQGVPRAVEGRVRVEKLIYPGGELAVDGVFFLKNSAPPAALAGGLKTEGAHVKTARDMSTSLKGLFAAGDVTGRPYQYIKAAGEGLTAAFSAHEYLSALNV